MKYVRQTGRPIHIRSQVHFYDYTYTNIKSKFAQHLLENSHTIGPIENIMEVLYMTNKGRLMDTMERVYMHKETCINNQINDKNTIKPDIIFETIVRDDTSRAHTSSQPHTHH
jgi:hypothetical protein